MKNNDLINNFIKIIKNINVCPVHSTKKKNICIKLYREYRLPSFPKTKATETLILITTRNYYFWSLRVCVSFLEGLSNWLVLGSGKLKHQPS
jgi:hypothetical protein